MRIEGLKAWRVSDVVDFYCVHKFEKLKWLVAMQPPYIIYTLYYLYFYTCIAGALKSDWLVLLSSWLPTLSIHEREGCTQ